MGKVYIIIQPTFADKINWRNLQRNLSNSYWFLLSDKISIDTLNNKGQADIFYKMQIIDNLDTQVKNFILTITRDIGIPKKDIHLITNDEWFNTKIAKLCEDNGLPGYSVRVINFFRDKSLMKQVIRQFAPNIRIPKYVVLPKDFFNINVEDALIFFKKQFSNTQPINDNSQNYPIFVKPIDSAGSIEGVKICSDEQFKQWFSIRTRAESQPYQFEADEFIDGTLYHCDIINMQGLKIPQLSVFVSRYFNPCDTFKHGKFYGSHTLDEPDEKHGSAQSTLVRRFQSISRQVLAAFNAAINTENQQDFLPYGAYHIEFFHNIKTDEIIFLELAARSPGVLISEMYEQRYGFNIHECHFAARCGLSFAITNKPISNYHWAEVAIPMTRRFLTQTNNPNYSKTLDLGSASIEFLTWNPSLRPGNMMSTCDHLGHYICRLLMKAPSVSALQDAFKKLSTYHFYSIKQLFNILNVNEKELARPFVRVTSFLTNQDKASLACVDRATHERIQNSRTNISSKL